MHSTVPTSPKSAAAFFSIPLLLVFRVLVLSYAGRFQQNILYKFFKKSQEKRKQGVFIFKKIFIFSPGRSQPILVSNLSRNLKRLSPARASRYHSFPCHQKAYAARSRASDRLPEQRLRGSAV